MFYKKENIPEENEIVLCTVKKILFHVVFVSIDEYKNLEGMVHISEVSPGRIRNLRDFVKESKRIVCKVLKIDKERKQIDLSLRRVSTTQTINKLTEMKQEEKAEKILEIVAKKLGISLEEIYKDVGYKIIEKYGTLTSFFYELVKEDKDLLKELTSSQKISSELTKVIKEKIKLPEIKISGILKLSSSAPDGINLIKKAIRNTVELNKKKKYEVKITYLGAPRYQLTVVAPDYKIAEAELKETSDFAISEIKKQKGYGEFSRDDK